MEPNSNKKNKSNMYHLCFPYHFSLFDVIFPSNLKQTEKLFHIKNISRFKTNIFCKTKNKNNFFCISFISSGYYITLENNSSRRRDVIRNEYSNHGYLCSHDCSQTGFCT